MTSNKKTKTVHLALHPQMFNYIEAMAEFYGLNNAEMMRKCFSDFYTEIYVSDRAGRYKGAESLTSADRRGKKESVSDTLQTIQTLPLLEAMDVIREIKFITPEMEEAQKCKFYLDGELEARDLWIDYGNGTKTSCYGSWPTLAGAIRKHLKNNK